MPLSILASSLGEGIMEYDMLAPTLSADFGGWVEQGRRNHNEGDLRECRGQTTRQIRVAVRWDLTACHLARQVKLQSLIHDAVFFA